MSTFNIRDIREISDEPLAKFANRLAKKLSIFLNQQQTDKLENKEDIYSAAQDIDTAIKYHADLGSTKSFDLTTLYYSTFEPDYDKLKLWLRGANIGNELTDLSGFNMVATIEGDPILMDGTPFDLGIYTGGTKSTCLRLNRPTSDFVNTERIKITDNSGLQISGISTGISYFIRFRIKDLAQQGSSDRRLFEKIDDTTPNNGVMLRVSSSGALKLNIKRSGTEYNNDTATGTIAANTVYDVWVTYTVSGNVTHIYVNNVDKTLSAGSSPTWHSPLSDLDMTVFHRGGTSSSGYTYGDLYDFRIYREKVVSSTEIGYMNTNKWTISDIPFGQVMVSNYWGSYT
jgi:hypothetical protein